MILTGEKCDSFIYVSLYGRVPCVDLSLLPSLVYFSRTKVSGTRFMVEGVLCVSRVFGG